MNLNTSVSLSQSSTTQGWKCGEGGSGRVLEVEVWGGNLGIVSVENVFQHPISALGLTARLWAMSDVL